MNERKIPKMWKHVAGAAMLIAYCTGPAYAQVVPGQYIVVLNNNVGNPAAVAQQLTAAQGAQLGFVYEDALKGFSFAGPAAAAGAIAQNPLVAFVEPDQVVHAHCHGGDPQVVPTGIQRIFADDNSNITINGSDDLRIDVDIAIIDTGIDLDHPDLNVVSDINCTKESGGGPPWARTVSCEPGGDDGNGHGTHCAGSAAAIDNNIGVVGVAPGARLWAVKVLDNNGSGKMSWVIAGIDWVTGRADQIEVANMSLGCKCTSNALNTAITNSVAAGVVYAVSAGNSNADAKDFSPANHDDVITVSALADFDGEPGELGFPTCRDDQDDTLADFSNWGSKIQITAPGVCILSLWKDGMCAVISGTSMSSPHVAGAAALLASGDENDPTSKANVDAIIQTLLNTGNFNWFDDSGDGIQEPLLDVSNALFAPATVPGSSTGGPTPSCGDGTCDTGEDSCSCPDDCGAPPLTELLCDDGVDNDCDGCIDGVDSDCGGTETDCTDGVDNDCDGFTDCNDADCDADLVCTCGDDFCDLAGGEDNCTCPADCPGSENPEVSCADSADNDCDGCIDGVDSDCGGTETDCTDGVDNDCDGFTDCDDDDCAGNLACPSCLPADSACDPLDDQCCPDTACTPLGNSGKHKCK